MQGESILPHAARISTSFSGLSFAYGTGGPGQSFRGRDNLWPPSWPEGYTLSLQAGPSDPM